MCIPTTKQIVMCKRTVKYHRNKHCQAQEISPCVTMPAGDPAPDSRVLPPGDPASHCRALPPGELNSTVLEPVPSVSIMEVWW